MPSSAPSCSAPAGGPARSTGPARRPPPRPPASSTPNGRSAGSTHTCGGRCGITPEIPPSLPPGLTAEQDSGSGLARGLDSTVRPMAVRTILHYPDARLREAGKKVESISLEFRTLIDDMAETMYAAPGCGLAATQVGAPWQIFVVDCAADGEPSDLREFINPEILTTEGAVTSEEGCLSFSTARQD